MQGAFQHVRLRELNRREMLVASCHACGHRNNIYPADVPAKISREIQLAAFEKQLRCGRCGQRGRASITVMQVRG
jgi:hypothetical protein